MRDYDFQAETEANSAQMNASIIPKKLIDLTSPQMTFRRNPKRALTDQGSNFKGILKSDKQSQEFRMRLDSFGTKIVTEGKQHKICFAEEISCPITEEHVLTPVKPWRFPLKPLIENEDQMIESDRLRQQPRGSKHIIIGLQDIQNYKNSKKRSEGGCQMF